MEGCILLVTPLTNEGRPSLKWVPHTLRKEAMAKTSARNGFFLDDEVMEMGNITFTLEDTMLLAERVIQDWTYSSPLNLTNFTRPIFEF